MVLSIDGLALDQSTLFQIRVKIIEFSSIFSKTTMFNVNGLRLGKTPETLQNHINKTKQHREMKRKIKLMNNRQQIQSQ